MGKVKVKDIRDKDKWEEYVLENKPKSFLHSWNWGEVQKGLGKRIYRKGYFRDNKLVGVSLFIREEAKRGRHFVVPGGPVIDWKNSELVKVWFKSLKYIARNERAWFVRVRPELLQKKENEKLFRKLGFYSSPMHLHSENTWVLGITKSEDQILMGMRKNTRYMVRKAIKSDLRAETSVDPGDVEILYKLQEETVKRHKFVGFSKKLFREQLKHFGKDDQTELYLIKRKDKVLVAAIIIFYGDYAYYHHSASSEESRNYPAGYLLQWQVIKDAKKRSLKYYNLWGIAPKGVEDHRFSGVTIFKKGFGGKRVDWLHAMDYPVNKMYWLTNAFERIRKRNRNL